MGILIKGTDMPKEGEFSCFRIYPDGGVTVELDGEEFMVAFASEVPDNPEEDGE